MRRIEIGIILSFLVATSAAAQCTLDLKANQTGSQAVLSWNKVAGATSYIVEESADSFKTITQNVLPDNAKVFTHRTSTTKKYSYRVTAANPSDPLFVGCTAVADVSYPADADLVKITNHHVIPFVGRTAGAGGALFKTSLRLTAPASCSGTLVFHRINTQASAADPQLRYGFTKGGEQIQYDDIVGAFGADGLGTIDIVPDFYTVPDAQAYLYNDAPSGRFGTVENAIDPADYTPNPTFNVSVFSPDFNRFRINIGVRGLTYSSTVIAVFDKDGNTRVVKPITVLDGELIFGNVQDLTGITLNPGDTIQFSTGYGAVVPFYTLTDNSTNDPTLIFPARQKIVPTPIDLQQ